MSKYQKIVINLRNTVAVVRNIVAFTRTKMCSTFMYNIRALIMIYKATIYAEEVPGLGLITFLISLFISHCGNSHWHTFKFAYRNHFVCGVNTGLWAQGPGASDNFVVDHCLKCIKLFCVFVLKTKGSPLSITTFKGLTVN